MNCYTIGWKPLEYSKTTLSFAMTCKVSIITLFQILFVVQARPIVRNIQSAHEFDRLLEKHGSETGLPVVVDYYSDSCGPCRMMAPIFKKVAEDYVDKAVFVKVDTNAQYEISSRYQIRSLPTFHFFVNGQKVDQAVGGIGEGPLRQQTDQAIRTAEYENVVLTLESLTEYYAKHDTTKSENEIQKVHQKCIELIRKNKSKACYGDSANKLSRQLKKKYGQSPKLVPRFTVENKSSSSPQDSSSSSSSDNKSSSRRTSSSSNASNKPNLHLATLDELKAELEKRMDEERDRQVENEDPDEEEGDPDFHNKQWSKSSFPERMIIIGAGPAGLAAAIYGARAGLSPLVIAPSMGGQLQGKGVDVENYPGLNTTGPAVVALMKKQAAHFGALFEDDIVLQVQVPSPNHTQHKLPLRIITNNTGIIETHTLIVATGAESNWLNIKGEYELRGSGVSSCATCDGFLYAGKHVVVVGGGDAAMEDALVLSRTSKKVTIIHRRDKFRASKVLSDRILQYHDPTKIQVIWNTIVTEIGGKQINSSPTDDDSEHMDMDNLQTVVSNVLIKNVISNETSSLDCDAVFVAIGHTPNTQFLQGLVTFNPHHPGYVQTASDGSTYTSVPGIFAAGDVADPTYRQAITSAGSGAAAALDAERYLSEHNLGNEAAEFEAELLREFMNDDSISKTTNTVEHVNVYDEAGGRIKGMKESVNAMASEL